MPRHSATISAGRQRRGVAFARAFRREVTSALRGIACASRCSPLCVILSGAIAESNRKARHRRGILLGINTAKREQCLASSYALLPQAPSTTRVVPPLRFALRNSTNQKSALSVDF